MTIQVSTIPPECFSETGYIYMRYLQPLPAYKYRKGDIVKFSVRGIIEHPAFGHGFHFEAGLMEEVTNVEKLLLDAGKMKYKEDGVWKTKTKRKRIRS